MQLFLYDNCKKMEKVKAKVRAENLKVRGVF